MAGLSLAALLRLMPIQTEGQMRQTLEGLAIPLDTAREWLREIQNEARPATATAETIDLWIQALGIQAAASLTLGEKRALADSAYSATGGQSVGYITAQVQKLFPNVGLTETGAFQYTVGGFYPYARDFLYLLALLQRISPAHLVAVYNVRSVFDGDVARCGIGTVGRAICGRGTTAYTPTEGTVARCGVGRVGLAITGRTAVI
jgi:hypothetical protein